MCADCWSGGGRAVCALAPLCEVLPCCTHFTTIQPAQSHPRMVGKAVPEVVVDSISVRPFPIARSAHGHSAQLAHLALHLRYIYTEDAKTIRISLFQVYRIYQRTQEKAKTKSGDTLYPKLPLDGTSCTLCTLCLLRIWHGAWLWLPYLTYPVPVWSHKG